MESRRKKRGAEFGLRCAFACFEDAFLALVAEVLCAIEGWQRGYIGRFAQRRAPPVALLASTGRLSGVRHCFSGSPSDQCLKLLMSIASLVLSLIFLCHE